MKKLILAAFVAALSLVGSSAPAFADSPGQLAGGDLYQVRNVTKNTGYGNSVAAACDETVKFSFKLSNTEFGMLYGVNVRASLPNGSATASATNSANEAISVSDTAAVSLQKGTLSYVAGTTQLLSVSGQLLKSLPDGVTEGGVNTGNLAGSTREFVQFQAKVNCPQPPVVVNIQVCELATKKIITIDEKNFDSSKHSKNLADCAPTPPQDDEITVCEVATGNIVNVKESDFDSSKYTRDLSDCAEVATPVADTPAELPETGGISGAMVVIASILTAAAAYAVQARRNILG